MSGLVAASFAREGYIGAAEAIEGKYGFLHAYASKPQPETAVAGLGTDWETMGIAVKPYPACRMTHAPADAAIELLRKHDIDPAKIAEIDIGLSRKGDRKSGVWGKRWSVRVEFGGLHSISKNKEGRHK